MDKVHHIAVQVDDIGRAVMWYQAHFQVDVRYQDESWAMVSFANIDLALVRPNEHPAHFAVERADAAGFGNLRDHRDGTRSTYIEDLCGNCIEILST
ncbi:MAG: VOC family protein [Proteobacteria bacterium]|jgi:hypothetical protein|nr:VOC family protein [Pseudomonadota bacterium]